MNLRGEADDLDRQDPALDRAEFAVPEGVAYFAGNSLGLQCVPARRAVEQVLDQWRELGVVGHFDGDVPWTTYAERLKAPMARVVGAEPAEVVVMNTLTVNLHLMLTSFYRPTSTRYRILIDSPCFPSDTYAVASFLRVQGYEPADALIQSEDVAAAMRRHGDTIAVALLAGVNYLTGELLDVAGLTAIAHQHGIVAGWDMAHAAGNVPLELSRWNVDFASWCTYKYMNSGPGSLAAIFVNRRHGNDPSVPRLSGWWSNKSATRFEMRNEVDLALGADGWQLSNPPILALASVAGALEVFDRHGMDRLRARSLRLTNQLERWLAPLEAAGKLSIITPRDPSRRGAQLSLRVPDAEHTVERLRAEHKVIADDRKPDIVRLAPAPLYNSYADMARAVEALGAVLS